MPTPVLLLHSTKETMDFVRWFHECAREREIQERDWFRLVFARWPGSSTLAYGGQVCNYLLVAIRGACKKAKKFQSYLLACSISPFLFHDQVWRARDAGAACRGGGRTARRVNVTDSLMVRRKNKHTAPERACTSEFRVQSLFELTNSKPTKLALKAVPSEQRTYAAMEHHMHTIRLQRTYTHSRTRGRHSALRASVNTLTGMTTDVHPRENCIAPAIALIVWTTRTQRMDVD